MAIGYQPTNARSCLREVMGLPVLELDSGRELGFVKECYFDPQESRLQGLLVGGRGQGENGVVIPLGSVKGMGKDAVTVEGDLGMDAAGLPLGGVTSLGKRVISRGGMELGTVKDVTVDCETGEIVGFEVSESLFRDLISGRRFVPASSVVTAGEALVVPDDDIGAAEAD